MESAPAEAPDTLKIEPRLLDTAIRISRNTGSSAAGAAEILRGVDNEESRLVVIFLAAGIMRFEEWCRVRAMRCWFRCTGVDAR